MPTGTFGGSAYIVGGRWRHHRTRDHYGTQDDITVVLASTIGSYPAGTTVADVLADFDSRLTALSSTATAYGSFTCSAFLIGTPFSADAVVLRTQTGSFGGSASIVAGTQVPGSFTASAMVLLPVSSSFTASAVVSP